MQGTTTQNHTKVVFFLLGDQRCEYYLCRLRRWNRRSFPKLRHIKFRRWGITQKKEYKKNTRYKIKNQHKHIQQIQYVCNYDYSFVLWQISIKEQRVYYFRLLWPCIMNVGWRERNQQVATNLMFIIKLLSQHVSDIIMPIIRRTRLLFSWWWA